MVTSWSLASQNPLKILKNEFNELLIIYIHVLTVVEGMWEPLPSATSDKIWEAISVDNSGEKTNLQFNCLAADIKSRLLIKKSRLLWSDTT